jgi:hypothetical protein
MNDPADAVLSAILPMLVKMVFGRKQNTCMMHLLKLSGLSWVQPITQPEIMGRMALMLEVLQHQIRLRLLVDTSLSQTRLRPSQCLIRHKHATKCLLLYRSNILTIANNRQSHPLFIAPVSNDPPRCRA